MPIGDRVTMGPYEAAHAARLLGVEHVVPIHYDPNVLPLFTGTPEELQKHASNIVPDLKVHVMQPGNDLAPLAKPALAAARLAGSSVLLPALYRPLVGVHIRTSGLFAGRCQAHWGLGRMDDIRTVALDPAPVVFDALKSLCRHSNKSPEKSQPTLSSLGFGLALRLKKVSARDCSAEEAAPKQKPVITPEGSTAVKREKPSYHPSLLDQPMSARPASQPCPRRFASCTGIAEASKA